MADSAYQTQYRQEFINGFEDRASVLRACCVTEAVIKGNQAIFLVADSGEARAVSRGVNGLIPARADNMNQFTAVLTENHDLVRKTGFNIFASQGNQNRMMQETSMGVINRKIDDMIIAELDTATNDTGTAQVASLDMVIYAQTILGNNFVDITDEENLFALVSPAFHGYMLQVKEFGSADYVDVKPFNGPARKMRRFGGFNWLVHPRLTNSIGAKGTSASEQCFFFHRNAIGSAANTAGIDAKVGYDEEQDYSFARTSIYIGAKLLQNSGVVMAKHNGAAYAAQ